MDSIYYESVVNEINELRSLSLTERNASISNLINKSIMFLEEALKLRFSNMRKEA